MVGSCQPKKSAKASTTSRANGRSKSRAYFSKTSLEICESSSVMRPRHLRSTRLAFISELRLRSALAIRKLCLGVKLAGSSFLLRRCLGAGSKGWALTEIASTKEAKEPPEGVTCVACMAGGVGIHITGWWGVTCTGNRSGAHIEHACKCAWGVLSGPGIRATRWLARSRFGKGRGWVLAFCSLSRGQRCIRGGAAVGATLWLSGRRIRGRVFCQRQRWGDLVRAVICDRVGGGVVFWLGGISPWRRRRRDAGWLV